MNTCKHQERQEWSENDAFSIHTTSLYVPMAATGRLLLLLLLHTDKETWSQSCHSFHAVKALALPNMSKRATLKTPRRCKYINTLRFRTILLYKSYQGSIQYTHRAFFVALFFDILFELARFLLRQNQSVQIRLNMYMFSHLLPSKRGFQQELHLQR